MKIYQNAAEAAEILRRGGFDDAEKAQAVRAIVADVRENGDKALFSYCKILFFYTLAHILHGIYNFSLYVLDFL